MIRRNAEATRNVNERHGGGALCRLRPFQGGPNRSVYRRVAWCAALVVGVFGTAISYGHPCLPPLTDAAQVADGSVAAPSILNAWVAKYPSSTLPARMSALTGSSCHVCHHPSAFGDAGNCYRMDLIDLLGQGLTPEQAIDQLDPLDSDDDGVPNGVEATTPRPEPGEIGYNMGLVGNLGTDPCASNPSEPVTGVQETPPLAIPAVSTWGLLVLAIAQTIAATVILRRSKGSPSPRPGQGPLVLTDAGAAQRPTSGA